MSGEDRRANPFALRAVLALVLVGALAFVATAWFIGNGETGDSGSDSGGHVGGKGLTGYAALANFYERQGHKVTRVQADDKLTQAGLLVLTPPLKADPKAIAKIIADRRCVGPTVLVLPKWRTLPARRLGMGGKQGWVLPLVPETAEWSGKLDGFKLAAKLDTGAVALDQNKQPPTLGWSGFETGGQLPDPSVQFVSAPDFDPLVTDSKGRMLVGSRQEHGVCGDPVAEEDQNTDRDFSWSYQQIVVAEPDLLNNWGMADSNRAMAALALLEYNESDEPIAVEFDLTMAGLAREQNLLTLAFKPPFLAATLCLLMAALAIGWRAFRRFGPPLEAGRAIAFGKRTLVANSGGLVRRSGRLHLLAAPYAALLRDRLVKTLALPRHADPAAAEAAIDRALAARAPGATPFSVLADTLRAARGPHELLRAGRALHALERTLTR